MVVAVGVLYGLHPSERTAALALLPMALVPMFSAIELRAVVALQAAHEWRRFARAQAIAAVSSLGVTVPVVLVTRSLVAASLQAALSEFLFAVLTTRAVRQIGFVTRLPEDRFANARSRLLREYGAAVTYTVLGWGQNQADRVAVGFSAGTATLGAYSLATSLARSAGEAASNASVNVLRAQIGNVELHTDRALRTVAEASLKRSLGLLLVLVMLTVAGTEFAIRPVLGAAWRPALDVVPALSTGTIPNLVEWSTTSVLQAQGRLRRALPFKAIGILFALPIGIVAASSLQTAAWLALSRDVFVAVAMLICAGSAAPWKWGRRAGLVTFLAILVAIAIMHYFK